MSTKSDLNPITLVPVNDNRPGGAKQRLKRRHSSGGSATPVAPSVTAEAAAECLKQALPSAPESLAHPCSGKSAKRTQLSPSKRWKPPPTIELLIPVNLPVQRVEVELFAELLESILPAANDNEGGEQ